MKKIIALDIDGVLGDLLPVWVDDYNYDWDDDLDYRTIDQWDLVPFVKPECGKMIYQYIANPNIYNKVLVISGATLGVYTLRQLGFRIIFVTSTPIGCSGRKFQWLNQHGFDVSLDDYYEASDKSLIASHYLVDDRDLNVQNAFGKGIIYTAEYNKNLQGYHRVNNWWDIVKYFVNIKNMEIMYGG